MNRPMIKCLMIIALLMPLASCQSDIDLQAPNPAGEVGLDLPVFDPDSKLAPDTFESTQSSLQSVYENFEQVDMVAVSHSYRLQTGGTFSFVPPGYPLDPAVRDRFVCSVSVPPGALSTNDLSSDDQSKATITLYVQAADYPCNDAETSNPLTTFALQTDLPGGLYFAEPVTVTICRHPLAASPDPEARFRLLFVESEDVGGKKLYNDFDAQIVTYDADADAFSVRVSYIPDYEPVGSDKDGGDTGHWGDEDCDDQTTDCPG